MKQKRKYYRVIKGKHFKIIKFKGKVTHASINGVVHPNEVGKSYPGMSFLISSTLIERHQDLAENISANNALLSAIKKSNYTPLVCGGSVVSFPINYE